MRILLKFRRYGLHAVLHAYLFHTIFGTFLVMLQGTFKIPAAVRPTAQNHYPVELVQQVIYWISVNLQGSLVSHKALSEAFFAEQTEVFPDILTGMKLTQDEGKDSACILALQ